MEITENELQEKIKNGEKIIVDFYTDWCGPCKLMKPIFERVSQQFINENSEKGKDQWLYLRKVKQNSN